ncbi:DUF4870 domain-containing protein [Candidatus Micrarchaeota archaeon]|nr:DUF4870 domain-containing protein [Candidatus Micrarchaeota archaeon]
MAKKKAKAAKVSKPKEGRSTSDSNLLGALAYLLGILTGIILYLAKPQDKYVKYHATQSILLTIVVWLIIVIIGAAFTVLAASNPVLWGTVGFGLIGLIELAAIILFLFSIWKAYSGEKHKLPFVGEMSEKHVSG